VIDHDQETNGRFFRLRLGPRNQQKITHPWTTTIRHQYFAHLVARRGCNNGGRLRRFNIRASLVKALPLLEEQHCVEWIDRGVCWQGTLNNLPLGSPCENAISQVVKFNTPVVYYNSRVFDNHRQREAVLRRRTQKLEFFYQRQLTLRRRERRCASSVWSGK